MDESNSQVKTLIEEYLKKAYFMQIATAIDGQPWACTVHFASDAQFRLIWLSDVATRHSQEIERNSQVAGAIVLPHKPDEPVMGIQFQGAAKKVTDKEECAMLMHTYGARFGMDKESIDGIVHGVGGHMCYVVTPTQLVLFDQIHFPENPRQVYENNSI